jgi:SAM-dependent methyltransferase
MMTATEWQEFMVRVHGYVPWDVRLVKQFEFLQDFRGRLAAGGRVLDVGAGQCEMRRFFEGFRYLGVDAAWGDPAWDYSKLDAVGDVRQLPFRPGSFDGAINLWVAEHVRDPVGMAHEIARVLNPGGWFLTFVPFVVHEHQTPHDYFRFTRFGAAALLEDAGFEQIEVVPDSSVGFAVAYEGVKHLNSLRNASSLPSEWKTHLDGAADILTRLAQHFAQDRQFPPDQPALSCLAMGRKPAQPAARRERPRPAARPAVRRLNLGCGNQKKTGWIGVDKVRTRRSTWCAISPAVCPSTIPRSMRSTATMYWSTSARRRTSSLCSTSFTVS